MSTPGDVERKKLIADNARDALRRINTAHTVEDWRLVGAQMLVITEEVMNELQLTAWDGDNKILTGKFAKRFEAWEKTVHNTKPLTKQERWALREFMTDQKYHNWLMDMPGPKQRKMNHPNAIINGYKRAHPDPKAIAKKRERITDGLEPMIDKLHDHLGGLDQDGQREVLERVVSPFALRLGDAEPTTAPTLETATDWHDHIVNEVATAVKTLPGDEVVALLGSLLDLLKAAISKLKSPKTTKQSKVKAKPAKKAKAVKGALKWKDGGNGCFEAGTDYHNYEAATPAGKYSVIAGTSAFDMKFAGYSVDFYPVDFDWQKNKNYRSIKRGIKTAERAKTFAQRDYELHSK